MKSPLIETSFPVMMSSPTGLTDPVAGQTHVAAACLQAALLARQLIGGHDFIKAGIQKMAHLVGLGFNVSGHHLIDELGF